METLPQFFVYDNIAIFSAELLNRFPRWVSIVVSDFPTIFSEQLEPSDVIVTAVRSSDIIDFDHFESIVSVEGTCVIDKNFFLLTLDSISEQVTIHILDVITSVLSENVTFVFDIENEEIFRKNIALYVNYGFVNPVLNLENKEISLKFHRRISPKTTFDIIERLLASTKTDRFHIMVSLPKTVAEVMAKTVSFMNEASGELSITNYNQQGEAVLGVNSSNIFEGTTEQTTMPEGLFSFHSHPDHITSEFNSFISWPSGMDMMTIARSFFTNNPIMAHFVVSPEGIWSVHPTFEFQKTTQLVMTEQCATALLDAILTIFAQYEAARVKSNVPAPERYKNTEQFLKNSNELKLSHLAHFVPELVNACTFSEDARIFSVSFHKWKVFENGDLSFIFDYARSDSMGLTPFIPPSVSYLSTKVEKLSIV